MQTCLRSDVSIWIRSRLKQNHTWHYFAKSNTNPGDCGRTSHSSKRDAIFSHIATGLLTLISMGKGHQHQEVAENWPREKWEERKGGSRNHTHSSAVSGRLRSAGRLCHSDSIFRRVRSELYRVKVRTVSLTLWLCRIVNSKPKSPSNALIAVDQAAQKQTDHNGGTSVNGNST